MISLATSSWCLGLQNHIIFFYWVIFGKIRQLIVGSLQDKNSTIAPLSISCQTGHGYDLQVLQLSRAVDWFLSLAGLHSTFQYMLSNYVKGILHSRAKLPWIFWQEIFCHFHLLISIGNMIFPPDSLRLLPQKSGAFLYTNKKHTKKEIKEIILFTIASKMPWNKYNQRNKRLVQWKL